MDYNWYTALGLIVFLGALALVEYKARGQKVDDTDNREDNKEED